jgi:hypothetical protein
MMMMMNQTILLSVVEVVMVWNDYQYRDDLMIDLHHLYNAIVLMNY